MCIFIVSFISFKNIISEKTKIQYKRKKKNLFVAKAIEANGMASIAGDLANKKYFSTFFYYVLKNIDRR